MEWEDPPESKSRDKWTGIMEELRKNPGRWAKFEKRTTTSNWASTQSRLKAEGFDATIRTVPNGAVLYARWPKENDAQTVREQEQVEPQAGEWGDDG